MASYLDKQVMNTAITDNTKLDMGHQHITTADFMQLNVATMMELVPGTKIDVNMESFARLNPMVVPTFGRASMRNRAFFVPFRTIFRGWNDFITDSVHVASDGLSPGDTGDLLPIVPYVSQADLCGAFTSFIGTDVNDGSAMCYQVAPNAANTNWDFNQTVGGTTSYYCYTVKGRQCLKLLEACGYKLDFDATKSDYVSALPLLALAKIYVDWYYPQQYSNRTEYDVLLSLCNFDCGQTTLQLTNNHVNMILSFVAYVQYDSDLFVSAWDLPNQPNPGNYSDFKLVNIDTVGQIVGASTTYSVTDMNGVSNRSVAATGSNDAIDRYGMMNAPFITMYANATTGTGASSIANAGISEYLLHGLHAMTDYMKRHQMAGSRAFDRYLARFGKALPAEKMNRCLYLGAYTQDIQIGDVMSTSDTKIINNSNGGAQLGSYAGKGLSAGGGSFTMQTDEYGYFFILSSIVPATGYYQGIDPQVFRLHKLDFWTPEYENLGVEPIKAANLYIPQVSGIMTTGDPYEQVFGFVPRYATYKAPTCMDRVTGNFRIPSFNSGVFLNTGAAWHLMRDFEGVDDFNRDWANVIHTPQFINGGADFSDYKRIFYEDDADSPDNFTVIHNFEIAEFAPMKPLYDTYEFEDKGKKVTLETNGVKLN